MKFQLKLLSVTFGMIALLSLPMTGLAENPIPSFEDPAIYIVFKVSNDDAQIIAKGGSAVGIKSVGIVHNRRLYCKGTFKNRTTIGQIVDNEFLSSYVALSCDLFDPPEFIFLHDGYENILMDDLVISFTPPDESEAIRLEIEDEEEKIITPMGPDRNKIMIYR